MILFVLIADDDAIIREGLKMIIRSRRIWSFWGRAPEGRKAVEMARNLRRMLPYWISECL